VAPSTLTTTESTYTHISYIHIYIGLCTLNLTMLHDLECREVMKLRIMRGVPLDVKDGDTDLRSW
jgi:hypothetical protein